MYKYTLSFIGRINGAIGAVHKCTIVHESDVEMSSIELLHHAYNSHEHITNIRQLGIRIQRVW